MKRILEVQKEIGTLSKKSTNPFFNSAYLDLNDLLNEVKPLMEKKGLLLTQPLEEDTVCTYIMDSESGNILASSRLKIPATLTDPQKIGSCITYFRRYTLKSLLAIAEEDDDGNKAAKPTPVVKQKLDDSKLEGCEKWNDKEKEAVIKKFDLTNDQILRLS